MAGKKETKNEAEVTESVAQFPVFSTTVYLNIKIGEEVYPAQTIIQDGTIEGYMNAFSELVAALAEKEGTPVYEPREIKVAGGFSNSNQGSGGSGNKLRPIAPDAPAGIPPCPIHGVPLKQRRRKVDGVIFYSCGERGSDGSWCNWSPPKEGYN